VTEGAVDDSIRHALTKMSHLHFVSAEAYKRRVVQMGEEDWRVTVSGAVSLDNLQSMPLLTPAELEQNLNVPLQPAPLLVTFHPVTREYEKTATQITEILVALEQTELPVIFTLPNADTNNNIIVKAIDEYVNNHANAYFVANLGTQRYFSLLKYALAMVGNSSSGIIEAASFQLPVVNIGNRQKGRLRGANVIDVPCEQVAILNAIHEVTTATFRQNIAQLQNPYGYGQAAGRIVQTLKQVDLGGKLLKKRFQDT
jgi:UDP-hydrolysing UDP-N-acetyl-D-glucosamine 2-epimerase